MITGSGIIPMCILNGEKYVFLQYITDENKLEDFGGGLDDDEEVIDGAIREFLEETNYNFYLYDDPENEIVDLINNNLIDELLINNRYVIFIVLVSPEYMNIPTNTFGTYELHDNIRRVCKWYSLGDLIESQHLLHPRLSRKLVQKLYSNRR